MHLILPRVKVGRKLYQSDDFFYLISSNKDTEDYILKITDAYYDVWQITVDPQILSAHAETLKSQNAMYPYRGRILGHSTLTRGL